jgi:hypothetical protein
MGTAPPTIVLLRNGSAMVLLRAERRSAGPAADRRIAGSQRAAPHAA